MGDQTTLKKKTTLKGIGLHSGEKVRCVIHPAPANHGIVFLRSDLSSKAKIRADISKVTRTEMNTTLGQQGVIVSTVEHLMSALAGLGVHNALIEVSGPELPILDGSALEFADAILDAGIKRVGAPLKILRLKQEVSVHHGDRWVIAQPSREFSIKASICFKHQMIGEQIFKFTNEKDFRDEIAGARTFGFIREVDYLHKKGLALGASLDNAVVLDEEKVLNPEGLRFKNEFVRHKILDAIGDFALLGVGMQASVEIHKSGHELHAAFIRKVLEDQANYEIVELKPTLEVVAAEVKEELPASLVAHAY